MDSNEIMFISKYTVENKPIYAKIYWTPVDNNLFRIKLLDRGICWFGQLSAKDAENFRNSALEEQEVFNNTVKEALIGCSDQYIYELLVRDGKTNFAWNKKAGDAIYEHGSVELERVTDEDTNTFLDFLINENQTLKENLEQCRLKEQSMKEELDLCKSELLNIANERDERDASMYEKFVQLLNTKKRRIQLLESTVRQIEADYNIN